MPILENPKDLELTYYYSSTQLLVIINRSRLIFEFYRTYDNLEPIARWLKRLEFNLRGLNKSDISSEQYLSSVNLLLMGEAVD